MNNIPFRRHHLHQFFLSWDEEKIPLDLAFYRYSKLHKSLGSNDRKEMGQVIYEVTKWRRLIDYPEANLDHLQRLERYFEGDWSNRKEDQAIPSAIRYSLPDYLWDKWEKEYGNVTATHLALISNTKAPLTIRTNLLKTTRENLLNELKLSSMVEPTPLGEWGIRFLEPTLIRNLESFRLGHFEVQDEGSQLLSAVVKVSPGETFLDFCAGSGGKSLAIAMGMEGKGQLFLHDIREHSLQDAKKRLKRAGIQNSQLLLPGSPNEKKLKKKCDWVLVDAPCSGTGTLRRVPECKWKIDAEFVKDCVGKQRKIFEKALSFVKPGGAIVYATCSTLSDENEKQVEHFLSTYRLALDEPILKLLPQEGGMDGFFAAKFRTLPV